MGAYKMGYELARAVQSFPEILCLALMLLQQDGDLWGQLHLSAGLGTLLCPKHVSLGRHGGGGDTQVLQTSGTYNDPPPEIRYAIIG